MTTSKNLHWEDIKDTDIIVSTLAGWTAMRNGTRLGVYWNGNRARAAHSFLRHRAMCDALSPQITHYDHTTIWGRLLVAFPDGASFTMKDIKNKEIELKSAAKARLLHHAPFTDRGVFVGVVEDPQKPDVKSRFRYYVMPAPWTPVLPARHDGRNSDAGWIRMRDIVARMTKDGEMVDGEEFVLENDDAVATLHAIIDTARGY